MLATLWVATALAITSAAGARPVTPACGFAASLTAAPGSGPSPLLVRFNATVTGGTPSEFAWSFGDGSYWNASGGGAATPLHRYATPGMFSASVVATESGCATSAQASVTVSPGPIVVVIAATPTGGGAPLAVQFNISITGGTGTYTSALWAFGDGGAGVGAGISYTYAHPGSYRATVTVTDSAHETGNASVAIVVRGPASTTPGWVPWAVGGAAAVVALAAVGGWSLRRRPEEAMTPDAGEAPSTPASHSPPPLGPAAATSVAVPPAEMVPGAEPPELPAVDRGNPGASVLPPAVVAAPPAERRQVSRTVLLHIGAQGRLGVDEVAPVSLTQAGMAEALGVSQNSLTNVLRRLVAAGVVEQDLRHVRGQPRRLRVYRLTARGESLYQDVRRRREGGAGPPAR